MSLQSHKARIDTAHLPAPDRVQISDEPVEGIIHFTRGYVQYWKESKDKNPDGTMLEILRNLTMIKDRKPFDREQWTEFAEVGHEIVEKVSPQLRDGFLRVTSHDKKRRIDGAIVCRSRIAIMRILQQRNPAAALRAVRNQMGQLPFQDTYVRRENALRTSFRLESAQTELLQRYRLALEMLLAELLQQTGREVDPELLERIDEGIAYFNASKKERDQKHSQRLRAYKTFHEIVERGDTDTETLPERNGVHQEESAVQETVPPAAETTTLSA